MVHFVDQHFDPVFFEGRVLFVEDDAGVAAQMLDFLRGRGYRVSHFTTVEEALDEFDRVKVYGTHDDAYDLAITDIDLAGRKHGEDLVTAIRAYEDGRGFIPIVALADSDDDQKRIAMYRLGVNDFLRKPVLLEELQVRIGNLLTNKRLLDKVHDIRRELYSLATTDELTGCHNRHSLMEFSDKFISQARRHGYPVSLLVIDLDHFKKINDTHGHAVGDIVLREVGALLNASFREDDFVTRYGGEEFVILMSYCDGDHACAKAERLRAEIERLGPNGLDITTSIGVTSMETGTQCNFEDMFHAGDEGVYRAKDEGRNRIVYVPVS